MNIFKTRKGYLVVGIICLLITVAVTVLMGCGAQPATASTAPVIRNFDVPISDGMAGRQLLNSMPFVCDGTTYKVDIINLSSRTVELRTVREWHGVDYGYAADFHSQVNRLSDGALVSIFQQDRYGLPGGLIQSDINFGDYPLVLAPGDGLKVFWFCNPISAGTFNGHVTLSAWWTWR